MAKAITKIKRMEMNQEQIRAKKAQKLEDEIADNGESLEKAIELIRALDEAGMLEALTALVKHKEDAIENIVTEANKERYSNVLENISGFMFLLGEIDVSKVQELSTRLNQGMEGAMKGSKREEKTSVMDLAKALRDPEINQGVTMMLHFLKGLGRAPEN
ncbi:DUF1641 domain-containing protein [Pontibacillus yanchengensis]|uniref:DUF1641 domain-containing protein n=2 Tax=Pontibacillus yanchengensis TaxID=462910 RepID=A0ACC7VC23_9BACI|nr:DUF1641 domain-containing protein [Pontibacillus yanchengensis]MYL34707.1 DUF1641 domain-containing protein [Pontibacillus yanchengensis]MYL52308.1 DUF1641 domain-containing protein [Pontibacillus yanchengensis]